MIPHHVNYDVCMCLCSHVYMSACMQRPEVGVWWLPLLLPILLLRCLIEFLTEIGAQQLQLDTQLQGSTYLCPYPRVRVIDMHYAQLLRGCCGSKPRSSDLLISCPLSRLLRSSIPLHNYIVFHSVDITCFDSSVQHACVLFLQRSLL